jgi:hypothetical protein
MTYRISAVLGTLALSALACSTEDSVNIGETLGSKLSDYSASWDGYAEAFQWSDGSDRIRLSLDATGQGTLRVGDLPLYPPPTDPNVGYPPEEPWDFFRSIEIYSTIMHPRIAYPVHETRIDSNRMRLEVDPHDLLRLWCQMQTPFPLDSSTGGPSFGCVPTGTILGDDINGQTCSQPDPATGEQGPIDCRKVYLCTKAGACVCDSTSCTSTSDPGRYPLDASLQMAGAEMVGTFAYGRITIRMTRN